MDRSYRRRVVVAMLVLVLAASSSVLVTSAFSRTLQGPPSRDQLPSPAQRPSDQQPTGTGRIIVVIVADDNGAPVKRAGAVLSGVVAPPRAPGGGPIAMTSLTTSASASPGGIVGTAIGPSDPARISRQAETDEGGRVEFTSLPAASYNVSASTPPSGFVRDATTSHFLQLREGQSVSVTIRLTRGGAISGRVLDEAGDPLSRASVRALRKDGGYGIGPLMATGSMATSDDRGQYRIYDLAPGDYYVAAMVTSPSPFGSQSAMQEGPRAGYLPTFHPAVDRLDAARVVSVRGGQDTEGIDVAMQRGRLGRVTGTAFDASNAPLGPGAGSVMLRPKDAAAAAFNSRSAPLLSGGAFSINDVPPGDYVLTASKVVRPSEPPAPGAAPTREAGSVPVAVNGDDVTVTVRTNKGAVLSGRVVVEGPIPPPPPFPGMPRVTQSTPQSMRVLVGMRPANPGPVYVEFDPGRREFSDDNLSFAITGARGRVILTVSSPIGAVKSIRSGGKDLLGVPLELAGTETIDDIDIVISTDTGWLRGSVAGADGRPAENAPVIVFSADNPRLWSVPYMHVSRSTAAAVESGAARPPSEAPPAGWRPTAPGDFLVARLLPGRYYVAAVDNGATGFLSPDEALLERLKAKATMVTIVAGETTDVRIKQ